jgi:hypothetical protein
MFDGPNAVQGIEGLMVILTRSVAVVASVLQAQFLPTLSDSDRMLHQRASRAIILALQMTNFGINFEILAPSG